MRVYANISSPEWKTIVPAARQAEEAGFDGVYTTEQAHDPFMPLALAAMATKTVELSTSVAIAFPRSPMIMANIAWDLHANSGGRFVAGLGTQVRGHNERRFSVPWHAPVPRMREYIQSLKAIWRCWEKGDKLDFEGEHYRFTLMTPEFSPKPNGLRPVPVHIAAVGPDMLRMAGRVADGIRLHSFCSRRYMEEVSLVRIGEGLEKAGRDRSQIQIFGGGLIAVGKDDEEVRKQMEWARWRIAFYGSTPAYRGVFGLHGLEELGARLTDHSKKGEWDKMAALVPDEIINTYVVVTRVENLAAALEERYAGIADTVRFAFPPDTPVGQQREVLQDIRRIPSPFKGYAAA